MNLRAESKQNEIRSNSSNLVLTRTTRTVGNILFSTLPVHGSEQSRPITCPVDVSRKISGSGLQIGDHVWTDVNNERIHPDRSNKSRFIFGGLSKVQLQFSQFSFTKKKTA